MRIAVTGANGFVGRYLLDVLAKDGNVSVLALSRRTMPEDCNASNCIWAVTDYSEDSLRDLLSGFDAVIHLAGTKGDKKDLKDFDSDFEMMRNLLDAVAKNKVRKILYASSRIVYGNPDTVPWKESYEPEPRMAYGVNKARCEELCRKYSKRHGIETASVRIAQVLGKGEGTKTMINVFQDLAREGRELTVIGKSVAKRQYIYAGDLAEILYMLAVNDYPDIHIVNAGMERAYTNLEIAEIMNRAYGNEAGINYDDSKPETISPSYMDVSILTKEMGYTPMDMEQALNVMANQ